MAHFFRGLRPSACKRPLAALLCCLLLAGTPVSAAEAPEIPESGSASVLEDLLQQDLPPLAAEEGIQPGGEATDPVSPDSSPSPEPGNPDGSDPEENPEGDPDIPEEPEVTTYTVTFQMGKFGMKEYTVEDGALPPETPQIPELPAAQVLGWFDKAGQMVEPAELPITENTTYTARWGRTAAEFLQTDTHEAYIKGYANGTFKPTKNVTRSEAAQLFYNLLRAPSGESVLGFPDVPASKWYAQAVNEMSAFGILQGYADGSFKGEYSITRAEFVKMAVSCDTLQDIACPFADVSSDSWAAPYIATAYSKGWISGYEDGTFRPNAAIVRGEAVVILNKMLGRQPDPGIKEKTTVKNFYDVFPSNWMYPHIVEASTTHEFTKTEEGAEAWGAYEEDLSKPTSGWIKDEDGKRYYLDGATRKFLRGMQTIQGVKYLLDGSTGAAFTGFRSEGKWRRYYVNGLIQDDISSLGLVSGPYYIKVYKPSNYLIIYAKEKGGSTFNVPVKAMRVSCGYGTPTGYFRTPTRYRWLQMIGNTWAQWCTQISGNYLFHSVPNWTHSNMDLEVGEYNHLGNTRSAGCIRLNCRDAKWIYDNCKLGTEVTITSQETSGPLKKPAGLTIPSWHTWDPTDPTAVWKCKQKGCH